MPDDGPSPTPSNAPLTANDPWRVVATSDGSDTLEHTGAGETYHSHHGAVTEARHVFLELSGVHDRLGAGLPVRVLEIGFGTGLNFLVTADAARVARQPVANAGRHPTLVYRAVDVRLPPAALLARLDHARHLEAPDLAHDLVAARARLAPDATRLSIRTAAIDLEVALTDATAWDPPIGGFDAVYLDAFSPDTQPELWTDEALGRWALALRPGGRLCTYSVKGTVRRRLEALGLEVHKRPGPPGGKREALLAVAPDA